MTDRVAVRTSIPGPWGPVQLAATHRGVVAIDWLTTEDEIVHRLERRLNASVSDAAETAPDDPRRRHLTVATGALEALLAGRPAYAVPPFDLSDRPAWDRRVLAAVADIPWGRTASYGEIARRVGSPRAARAVGGAVGRNPISLLIPCHRVIAADGGIGGYGGDWWGSREERLAMKRSLLAREGVAMAPAND